MEALRAEIDRLLGERPLPGWVSYDVILAKFATTMTSLLEDIDRQGLQLVPTFAFVDPFGFADVPLKLLARIAANPSCECFVTFMYEPIKRFITHPEPGIQAHYDALFGTTTWRELLGSPDGTVAGDRVSELYRRQLLDRCGFRYVRTFEMMNEGNRTEYLLYFATNNATGLSKMKEAMWAGDPMHGSVFSDRTDPKQVVLFDPADTIAARLQTMLTSRFRGKGATTIEEVERFVLEETPYCEKRHLKRMTLKPMEIASPPLVEVRRPRGRRAVAGTYPVGTTLKFL